MDRIHITDTVTSMMVKMSEGNPGALTVAMELLKDNFHYLLMCDTLELYGTKLYMFWNDCCGRDLEKMKKVIDLWQRGTLSKETIHKHLDGGYGKPFEEVEEPNKKKEEQ